MLLLLRLNATCAKNTQVKQLNAAEFFEKNCQIAGFDNVRTPVCFKFS